MSETIKYKGMCLICLNNLVLLESSLTCFMLEMFEEIHNVAKSSDYILETIVIIKELELEM